MKCDEPSVQRSLSVVAPLAMEDTLKFSLVLATVDRTVELERFLKALDEQSYREFELIVVDQNSDDRLTSMLEPYRGRFSYTHLRSSVRGLSRARNLGIKQITGDVVSFPDDDCWYPPNALDWVAECFRRHPEWGGVCGRSVDEKGRWSHARWPKRSLDVDRFHLWAVSFAIFLRREVVDATGDFDETLGVGAGTPWGSCEEGDYVLRALEKRYRIVYDPELFIFHPRPLDGYDTKAFNRAYYYAMGQGRFFRKHNYPASWVLYRSMSTLGGSVLALATGRVGKAIYHWKVFEGRLRAWKSSLHA